MDTYEKLLAPYQVQNGGNLILMQIENEFSSQRIGDCKTCPPNLATIDYMEVWFYFLYTGVFFCVYSPENRNWGPKLGRTGSIYH